MATREPNSAGNFGSLVGTNSEKPMEQVVHRLSPEALAALERQLPSPAVTRESTEATLAAAVAYQHCLKVLRDGFTVQR
ncbi:hypothetical protein AVU67_gp26 [Ralstonia phage RSJ2]|uniref:Uncharacterized protein n=1 Tax=Ralstonia phage RSJ2 TaxID=1481785 RepID=A0A068Q6H3_9CAUD|nr:hypothetical protein AVU67_gp26 [Ralstonia phage RSJ2]BAP15832.1 hypothetical protein [Ralstonia phage RSJ2]